MKNRLKDYVLVFGLLFAAQALTAQTYTPCIENPVFLEPALETAKFVEPEFEPGKFVTSQFEAPQFYPEVHEKAQFVRPVFERAVVIKPEFDDGCGRPPVQTIQPVLVSSLQPQRLVLMRPLKGIPKPQVRKDVLVAARLR